ncbi:hypothetical protein ACLKA6_000962 [Drosophila palustris]
MNCATCKGNSEETSKCVLSALDTIKTHFLMMQNLCLENASTIGLLKQHNEKLHNAIDLLQEKQEQRYKSSPKRRRFSPKKSQQKQQQRSNSLPLTDSPKVPESQSSLNLNIALQPDDDEEETITETVPPISPYKPLLTRHKLNKFNCENERPDSAIKTDKKNDWLCKVPKDKTKMSLTLRSNSPRLKQTRLHFDASKANNDSSDKEVIESSPNLYSTLKHAKHSRSLLQRPGSSSVVGVNSTASTSMKKNINNNQPVFEMDDDDSFFDLCPDPTLPKSLTGGFPPLSGVSDTSSVVMLTPGTQDIVFIDDSIEDTNQPLNTLDFMAEAIKEDDKVSMTKLQEYEANLIREQKMAAARGKPTAPTNVKVEQLTEQTSAMGNESTKLPEDFELEDEEDEEEDGVPRPILIKQEHEPTIKERYNIDCDQCEKFINFMGANMTDVQIREYLCHCRHIDQRELDNNTPEGFWNPHLVSFAEDDPRSKVHVDQRLINKRKK